MDLYSVLIFCTLFLIQILGLYVFVRYAHRLGLSDKPNLRSSHDYAVVRGGGIIFGLSWLAGCLIQGTAFTVFNLGLILLMVIGLWDDIRGLSSFVRLIVQFFSVFLLALHFDFIVVFGLLWTGLLILILTPIILGFNNKQHIYLYSFLFFWFLTINHAAMRIAAPGFIYALSLLKVSFEDDTIHR